MKKLFFIITLIRWSNCFAQEVIQWQYYSKKISENVYDVYLKAQLQKPWHIYSQKMQSGGPIPTRVYFDRNGDIKLLGPITENGKLISKYESAFAINTKYYEDSVIFKQRIQFSKKSIKIVVSGKIYFMLCSQKQCVPPSETFFSLDNKIN